MSLRDVTNYKLHSCTNQYFLVKLLSVMCKDPLAVMKQQRYVTILI